MDFHTRKHVHNALMETMIGAFCLSIILGSMLGFEYTVNGNAFIPTAHGQVVQSKLSVSDSQDKYMDCDCVGPNITFEKSK